MQAHFDSGRSNPLLIACVYWAAGLVAALAGLVIYIAVQAYDPTVSCGELLAKADRGEAPPDVDGLDDWELLCGYYDLN